MSRYEIFVLDYLIKQQNQNGILWWYPNGIIGCFSPTVKGEKNLGSASVLIRVLFSGCTNAA